MSVEIVNLSNYLDRTGTRVEPGSYLVRVEEIEVGETRETKAKMWTVYLTIIGGEEDGMTLVERLTHSEKAMFRVVAFLQGMGVKIKKTEMRVDISRFIGRKVVVQVDDGQPFKGRVKSEVRAYERYKPKAAEESSDLDDLEDTDGAEEVEEVEEAPKKSKKAAPAPEPEDDEANDTVDDADIDLDDVDI